MDIKNMIAVVQMYIHIRKGIEVDISIRNQRDVVLLLNAYTIASEWMEINNVKIKRL